MHEKLRHAKGTGYLPRYLNGMDIGVKAGERPETARKANFTRIEMRTEFLGSGEQDIQILRKWPPNKATTAERRPYHRVGASQP